MSDTGNQRVIVFVLSLVGIGLIIGAFIFLLIPTLRDVNMLSRDVLDAQTELEAQYAHRKNLLSSISDVSRIRQTTENLKSQFIEPGNELLFITRIEETAAAHNVDVTIRLSGKGRKGAKVTGVNDMFDIGLIGTYSNVLSAIRSIERLPNMTIINAVSIRAGDLQAEAPTVISASVRGTIAFTPEGL